MFFQNCSLRLKVHENCIYHSKACYSELSFILRLKVHENCVNDSKGCYCKLSFILRKTDHHQAKLSYPSFIYVTNQKTRKVLFFLR